MKADYYSVTCDLCGHTEQFETGVNARKWWELHEMAIGEGGDSPMYKWGHLPLIPKRHICPECSEDLFEERVDDDDEDERASVWETSCEHSC